MINNELFTDTGSKSGQRFIIYACLMTIYVFQKLLVVAYQKKSEWYNPVFLPPDYYGKGSLMED